MLPSHKINTMEIKEVKEFAQDHVGEEFFDVRPEFISANRMKLEKIKNGRAFFSGDNTGYITNKDGFMEFSSKTLFPWFQIIKD